MIGQVNAAHSAGADVTQQLILAKKEALVFSTEQLGAVPLGNELPLLKDASQFLGIGWQIAFALGADLLLKLVYFLLLDQATLGDKLEELF